jgi:hypothetical protein
MINQVLLLIHQVLLLIIQVARVIGHYLSRGMGGER